MTTLKRIYYNAVCGAIGGLLGWMAVGLFEFLATIPVLIAYPVVGALVGLFIGTLVGAVDGARHRSPWRLAVGILGGGGLGLIGGAIGLFFGEGLFLLVGGGFIGRTLGWGLLGLLVGLSDGLANISPRKSSYGAIGGLTGGLVGGLLYEGLTQICLLLLRESEAIQIVAGALGLIILGACIGSLIALVEEALKRAWVRVIYGRQEGQEFTLTKRVSVVGSQDRHDVPVVGDPGVAPRHAEIRQEHKQFVLYPLTGAEPPLVNKQPVNSPRALQDRDELQFGRSRLLFRTRR